LSKRAVLALSAAVAVLASLTVFASSASAVSAPAGRFASATQLTTTHDVTVTGWAFDPARPNSAAGVMIYLDGKYVSWGNTNVYSAGVNREYGLTGLHSFRFVVHAATRVSSVTIRMTSKATGKLVYLVSGGVSQYTPPGTRIITAAKKYYQARVPYRDGGTTPYGFDCSGYTQYVYREARVSSLPRTAEQQRQATKRLTRTQLRPGDLIFYLSGASSYHVAIYAGNGMQYAEATPSDGLRYQKIWSSDVQYGTTWH
jgi:cell wall-associated NlpC family hydrolase